MTRRELWVLGVPVATLVAVALIELIAMIVAWSDASVQGDQRPLRAAELAWMVKLGLAMLWFFACGAAAFSAGLAAMDESLPWRIPGLYAAAGLLCVVALIGTEGVTRSWERARIEVAI